MASGIFRQKYLGKAEGFIDHTEDMVARTALILAALAIGVLSAAGASDHTRAQDRVVEAKMAQHVYGDLLIRIGRIKSLSMTVSGSLANGTHRVVFPPAKRRPKDEEGELPKAPLDCFRLTQSDFDHAKSGTFRGQAATILEHFPNDGGDSYDVLYISKKTGWPLACGYSLSPGDPVLAIYTNLRVTLKRKK